MELYEKDSQVLTQCYFCGEELTPPQLELHVKHCGLVLEPCPDKCGLYVQRQYKNHHANWCKKDPQHINKSMENDLKSLKSDVDTLRTNLEIELKLRHQYQADWEYQVSNFNKRLLKVEELSNKIINALTSFKKLISEEREARIKDFNDIKTNLIDVCKLASQLKFSITQTQIDISEMKNNFNLPEKDNKFYEEFEAWKGRQEIIVASLKLKVDRDLNEEIYKLHKANITRSKSVSDLLDLNEIIIDEQDRYAEQIKTWHTEIERFKLFLSEENIMISGIWRDQLEEIKKLKSSIEKFDCSIKQLHEEQILIKDKLEKLELKHETNQIEKHDNIEEVVSNLLGEGVFIRNRIEDLEKMFRNMKPAEDYGTETNNSSAKDEENIKSRLTNVENVLKGCTATLKLPQTSIQTKSGEEKSEIKHIKGDKHNEVDEIVKTQKTTVPTSKYSDDRRKPTIIPKKEFENLERLKPSTSVTAFESGRVTWSITNFTQNMKLAKENNEEFQGPIFYNCEFGYKFQLKAYLNGIGQWKGRHLIISLHVLQSEWDDLLKWPCRIHVVICLVDQVAILRKAKDIVKSFTSSAITRHSDYKCLQMFIPHRTLAEHSYLKEDTLMLRVKLKVISV